MYISGMDLGHRISNVPARIAVKKPEDLSLNILYSIIRTSRSPCFTSTIDLILYTPEDGDVSILFLSEEYSDVFTDEDIEDINRHNTKYFLVCENGHVMAIIMILHLHSNSSFLYTNQK
jgi:hypothetical protein